MNEKKDTKTFIFSNDHIFDDSHLDERQKAETYKITFRLFIAMTYTILILSMTVVFFAVGTPNTALLIAGAAGMIITQLFIVLYAAMTSSKGAMNPEFARRTSSPAYVVFNIAVAAAMFWGSAIGGVQISDIYNIFLPIYATVYVVESLLLFYYSKRNMKVLEKQLKDDEENDDE